VKVGTSGPQSGNFEATGTGSGGCENRMAGGHVLVQSKGNEHGVGERIRLCHVCNRDSMWGFGEYIPSEKNTQ
jgi:hypothetical protein